MHEIAPLGQDLQPRVDAEVGMGVQKCTARAELRADFRAYFRVHFRADFQRDMLCYLTTVMCSENRPKAGMNSSNTTCDDGYENFGEDFILRVKDATQRLDR